MQEKSGYDDDYGLYGVLGLKKECTNAELRIAYKKLAMKWHPDRCSASGNSKHLEEAKEKFQAIQQAYAVLSDGNKRFLYDVGVYNNDDDNDENGMGDFLNEMTAMMSQNKSSETGNGSFEELQHLFVEIFKNDISTSDSSSSSHSSTPPTCYSSQDSCNESCSISNKRNLSDMRSGVCMTDATQFSGFCIGTGGTSRKFETGGSSRRKNTTRTGRR